MHDSAVQASLMQLCDKSSAVKTSGGSSLRSGVTCNTCGGRGHYARECASKGKAAGTIKVNVAVTKITTRDEYRQHLPDTKRQIGDCPCCKQSPHMYSRKFPFGNADWPSNRLESCPQFIGKSSRQRGELIEQLNGCYKCTSWKHTGDACFTKKKTNCTVVTAGSACAGVHHKLLHGSGVAFCHHVKVEVAKVHSRKAASNLVQDNMELPGIDQPVLLEVQLIRVHEEMVKVMFDNGSSTALITHGLAQRLGLQGEKVEYWLMVVGHESVLRETMLYTFSMVDNYGTSHSVRAYGIDQITDESRSVDLEGVKAIFPGAPSEVYDRPQGPIEILIGSMFRNIQPYGGEESFTRGRLRLVQSIFGCGYILTGTHPSISVVENLVTPYAKTLATGASLSRDNTNGAVRQIPAMSCNKATAMLKLPEFFEAEEIGVAPARSCRKCRGCQECSYRGVMVSREREMVVRRIEDQMKYNEDTKRITVAYPWTEDVVKLTDNVNQVVRAQRGVETRLLRDPAMMEFYNSELQKFIDRGAIRKLSQEELDGYNGPVSYVTHHPVFKPDSTTTPLRIVTNSSFMNENA